MESIPLQIRKWGKLWHVVHYQIAVTFHSKKYKWHCRFSCDRLEEWRVINMNYALCELWPGKPNSVCKWCAVCHILGKCKGFGVSRKIDLAINQLLRLVEFGTIFKHWISVKFQLIVDKCFLNFLPFNEPGVFLFRTLSDSEWNIVQDVWHSLSCIFRE